MPNFSLRPATANDEDDIHALVREGRINPTGLDWKRFVVAIVSSGQVIGCGQIKPHRDGSQELASIVVTQDWRGRGVARAIIEFLLASHPVELYLMCRPEMGSLYEKFGFMPVEEAELPRYFRLIRKMVRLAEYLHPDDRLMLVMRREAVEDT